MEVSNNTSTDKDSRPLLPPGDVSCDSPSASDISGRYWLRKMNQGTFQVFVGEVLPVIGPMMMSFSLRLLVSELAEFRVAQSPALSESATVALQVSLCMGYGSLSRMRCGLSLLTAASN